MSFAQSPEPRVVNAGLRIIEIREQLNAAGWDMAALNAALQALTDDSGTVVIPNGTDETAPDMRQTFERLPQVTEQALSLYEVEFKKFAPTLPEGGGD